MDLSGWLRSLGLEQYETAFRDNAIDDTVLLNLTAEDLKDLGVALVGHRRKLLDAIADLRNDGSAKAASSDVLPTIDKSPKDAAERRQVTVMFSDLVGSTALAAHMDPEDLRELISAYQKCVVEAVRRFGGFVAKYMGDGVLVYFGYPQAHEDDAERAVRAGLELIGAVTGLRMRASLQTRVGIATGLVVVGDLIGSGEAQERGIVGETPNLAARLQGIAGPNTVVVAESTRRLLGMLFEFEDLGPRDLKGITGPSRAWAVLRASSVASRFEALHATGLTALVGREEEFELMLRRWSKAKAREGQVVLISGEAGIGKSRLTAALLERLAAEPHTRWRAFCSPQHTDSALHPTIGQMEQAAGLALDDPPQARLDKLDTLLKQTSTSIEDAALFAEMLSLPNDGRYLALDLTPQQRRQRTLEALVLQIEALARQRPVLMIFEDAHWTDPTSLELLGQIVERIQHLRVLLIVTFRPEFDPPWVGRPHVTALTINRLTERDIDAMIDRVVGNHLLSATVRQDIIERSDGIPLFVEEMTKAALEAESEDAAERTLAAVPSPALAVPPRLHASLMARLDRLGAAKGVAQIGATIGREFSYDLLASVAQKTDEELRAACSRLSNAGLAFCLGTPPHATFLFKHALVRDAAYASLLRTRRQQLNASIASALEAHWPEIVAKQPERLAQHWAEAGSTDKAIIYWALAGRQSIARHAMIEAAAQARKGLVLLETFPDGPTRWRRELELQSLLGGALNASIGAAAPETGDAYARARVLGERVGDVAALVQVLGGQSAHYAQRCELAAHQRVAEDLLRLGERENDLACRVQGHRIMGAGFYWLGEFRASREHLERALSLYVPAVHRSMVSVVGFDARAAPLSNLSYVLFILGYPDQALSRSRQALSWARELGHPHVLVHSLIMISIYNLVRRAGTETKEALDELVSLTAEHRFQFWMPRANLMLGRAVALQGEVTRGLALMKLSFAEETARTHHGLFRPFNLALIAQTCESTGQVDEALGLLAEALDTVERTGERQSEAELYRLKGEWLLAHRQQRDDAEACLTRAISVAHRQGAKMFELRAAMGLARLWGDQGKRAEARELLAPVSSWFTEGFDTPDLKEAKALLEELG
jgi:class 3 adenylate cyclase/tetratricopeptide (TPR) repeat protein